MKEILLRKKPKNVKLFENSFDTSKNVSPVRLIIMFCICKYATYSTTSEPTKENMADISNKYERNFQFIWELYVI